MFENIVSIEDYEFELENSVNQIVIYNSQFIELPHELLGNSNELFFANNSHVDIFDQSTFVNVSKLIGFYFRYGNLNYLFKETFTSLVNLKRVDVSHNLLTGLDGFVFNSNLEELTLSHNYLSFIRLETLSSLTSLTSLDMSYNNIIKISYGLFSFQSELRKLNLSFNRLAYLHDFTVTLLELNTLLLHGVSHAEGSALNAQHFEAAMSRKHRSLFLGITNSLPCSDLLNLIKKYKQTTFSFDGSEIIRNSPNIFGVGCLK